MEKIFENVLKINTRANYERVLSQVKKLVIEGAENGALDDPEADNEYIREIGRLSHLGAEYENEYIKFEHIKVRKKTSSLRKIEEIAELLEYA